MSRCEGCSMGKLTFTHQLGISCHQRYEIALEEKRRRRMCDMVETILLENKGLSHCC